MKRLIAVFLSACLILSLFVGCQTEDSGEFPKGFSKAKAKEIAKHWIEENPYYPIPWYHIDGFGAYYLGNDNGYDIFYYYSKNDRVVTNIYTYMSNEEREQAKRNFYTQEIGSSVFYPCSDVQLNVYKNGEFLLLEEAYEQGLVSSEAVATAEAAFNTYVQIILEADPMELLETEWNCMKAAYAEDEMILEEYRKYYETWKGKSNPHIDWYKSFFDEVS